MKIFINLIFLPSWILFSWSSICSTQFKKLIKCKVWSRKYQSFQNMRKYSKKKYSIIFYNDQDQIMKLRIQILRIKKFITNFQRKIKELLLADWNFFPNLGVNYNNFLHSNSKTILSPLSFASSSLFSFNFFQFRFRQIFYVLD